MQINSVEEFERALRRMRPHLKKNINVMEFLMDRHTFQHIISDDDVGIIRQLYWNDQKHEAAQKFIDTLLKSKEVTKWSVFRDVINQNEDLAMIKHIMYNGESEYLKQHEMDQHEVKLLLSVLAEKLDTLLVSQSFRAKSLLTDKEHQEVRRVLEKKGRSEGNRTMLEMVIQKKGFFHKMLNAFHYFRNYHALVEKLDFKYYKKLEADSGDRASCHQLDIYEDASAECYSSFSVKGTFSDGSESWIDDTPSDANDCHQQIGFHTILQKKQNNIQNNFDNSSDGPVASRTRSKTQKETYSKVPVSLLEQFKGLTNQPTAIQPMAIQPKANQSTAFQPTVSHPTANQPTMIRQAEISTTDHNQQNQLGAYSFTLDTKLSGVEPEHDISTPSSRHQNHATEQDCTPDKYAILEAHSEDANNYQSARNYSWRSSSSRAAIKCVCQRSFDSEEEMYRHKVKDCKDRSSRSLDPETSRRQNRPSLTTSARRSRPPDIQKFDMAGARTRNDQIFINKHRKPAEQVQNELELRNKKLFKVCPSCGLKFSSDVALSAHINQRCDKSQPNSHNSSQESKQWDSTPNKKIVPSYTQNHEPITPRQQTHFKGAESQKQANFHVRSRHNFAKESEEIEPRQSIPGLSGVRDKNQTRKQTITQTRTGVVNESKKPIAEWTGYDIQKNLQVCNGCTKRFVTRDDLKKHEEQCSLRPNKSRQTESSHGLHSRSAVGLLSGSASNSFSGSREVSQTGSQGLATDNSPSSQSSGQARAASRSTGARTRTGNAENSVESSPDRRGGFGFQSAKTIQTDRQVGRKTDDSSSSDEG